jgi:hypothetical protein
MASSIMAECVVRLSVVMLSVVMLSVIMLSDTYMPSVIMVIVVLLSVVAPKYATITCVNSIQMLFYLKIFEQNVLVRLLSEVFLSNMCR